MQSLRTTIRQAPKHLHHITKPASTTTTTRHISHIPPTMSLFPRFTQEFAPMFRLFDEFDRQSSLNNLDQTLKSLRTFTPKFDVSETAENYELHGELPGVDQKNIDIQWTDSNTLTISGRHEHVREEGQKVIEDAAKELEKQHQPTVEEEDVSATETQVAKQPEHKDVVKNDITTTNSNKPKYWVSERSVGEFHRSFAFPARVDQDAVKASLKNGILSIVVPKAKAPLARKINIE